MKKILVSLGALALATSLGACTYQNQRDILTGAIAGTTVGLAQAAIGDGGAVENMVRGAAIGAAAGAARGVAENVADRVFYPNGTQGGTGYQDPYYSGNPYGSPNPYNGGQRVAYASPNPYYGSQSVSAYPRY